MASILMKRGRGRFETDKLGESTHTEDHVKVEQGEMQPQAKEWKLEEAKNGFSPTELEEVVRLQVGTGHICL